eukprot:Phypoly_transcript_21916.p1 GENE.Phypoly_transcript_21916~~Phypoly_transcript_21916.p1  ORF type:complete len:172 (+),score=20.84 Phypoly_transcript_21916:51-518(+)
MSSMLAFHSGKTGFKYYLPEKDDNVKLEELDIIHEYTEMKISQKHKYIMFKIAGSDIVMSETGPPSSSFQDMKNKVPPEECRYIVYNAPESRLVFIFWCPETAKLKDRMWSSSSKSYVLKRLHGLAAELTVEDLGQLQAEFIDQGKLPPAADLVI